MSDSQDISALVAAIRSTVKYRDICTDVIRRVGARELATRRNLKAAIKATKSKLHQVGAAYFTQRAQYDRWLRDLAAASQS